MWIQNKACHCVLFSSGENNLQLNELFNRVPELRGKGYASDILLAAKKYAKRVGKTITLFVGPFADRPMDKEQLIRFYNKRGFFFSHMSGTTVYLKYNPKGEMK